MVNYKTVRQFSAESGYTEAAIRTKIRDGIWPKHAVWRHAPDGRVLIDVRGYEVWVESTIAPKRAARRILEVATSQKGRGFLSPPPLT